MKNIQRYNQIYQKSIDVTWSNTELPDKVVKYLNYIKNNSENYNQLQVLDVGCGRGRLIKQLIKDGWKNITGIEIAAAAVSDLPPKIRSKIIVGDFLKQKFTSRFDVIVDITMTCSSEPKNRKPIFSKVFNLLNQGGYYLGEFFTEQVDCHDLDQTWCLNQRIFRRILEKQFVIVFFETDLKIQGSVFFCAQKSDNKIYETL